MGKTWPGGSCATVFKAERTLRIFRDSVLNSLNTPPSLGTHVGCLKEIVLPDAVDLQGGTY